MFSYVVEGVHKLLLFAFAGCRTRGYDMSLQTTGQGLKALLHQQEVEAHTREVDYLIQHLLALGSLRALQVAALHSRPSVNLSDAAASGLQHLALACERLSLHSIYSCPPLSSIHVLTWVRPLGHRWVLDSLAWQVYGR